MIIGVRKIGTISEVPLLVSPHQSSVDMSDNEIVRWYTIAPRKNFRCRIVSKYIGSYLEGKKTALGAKIKKRKIIKKKNKLKKEAKCTLFSNSKNDSEEYWTYYPVFWQKREEAKLTLKGGETGIKRIRVARNHTVPFPLPSSPGPTLFKKKKRKKEIGQTFTYCSGWKWFCGYHRYIVVNRQRGIIITWVWRQNNILMYSH